MNIPLPLLELVIYIVAGLGTVLLIYGVFLGKETRQDAVFAIGAGCLFVYALWIGNRIFMVAMGVFSIASLIELIEIMVAYHKHSKQEVRDYKKGL